MSTTAAAPTTKAAAVTEAPAAPVATDPATSEAPAEPAGTDAATTVAEAPAVGGSLVVGLDSEPQTLDPAANSLSLANGSVYSAIYETLTYSNPGEEIQLRLLDSLTESEDRLSWTLVVKDGVKFHDGTTFDAEAVKFNLERQKQSLYNQSSLLPVTAIDVVDPKTVKLTLAEPWTALPNALGQVVGVMVSPTAAADGEAFKRNPVGTGPYQLSEWIPGDKVALKRFDGYWGDKAALDELTFKFIGVEAARVAAFEAGEIDAFTTITEATVEEMSATDAQIASPPPTGYGFSYFNLTRPPFDDVRVRQALQLAVDRDAIAEAYQGETYEEAAYSPFDRDSKWWVPPAEQPTYDPDGAKALLADYGKPVEFQFKLLAGNQEFEDAVRATIGFWEEVGVKAELVLIPDLGTYINDVVTGNYDMLGFLGGSLGDPDAVTYNLLHTGGSSNFGKYSNPVVDKALELGRRSEDEAERKAAYATVQEEFRKDLPISISSHGKIYFIAKPEVKGLVSAYFFPARTVSR